MWLQFNFGSVDPNIKSFIRLSLWRKKLRERQTDRQKQTETQVFTPLSFVIMENVLSFVSEIFLHGHELTSKAAKAHREDCWLMTVNVFDHLICVP